MKLIAIYDENFDLMSFTTDTPLRKDKAEKVEDLLTQAVKLMKP